MTGHVDVALYPEGGDLVAGLPSRVYLRATDPLGEPADVAGVVVDDRGTEVASFRTVREGLGRFALQPAPGRRYTVRLTEPAGTAVTAEVPEAKAAGCVLRTYDDLEGVGDAIRVGVRCTDARTVAVQATLREQVLDTAGLAVVPGAEAVAWLTPSGPAAAAQGAARVTVFDGEAPLAERLVFRHRTSGLQVEVAPAEARVTPRSEVVLDVRTRDAAGQPVAADVAVAVVDDTVLKYADDEHGDLVAALLLHPELPEPVREPERYLAADDPEAALALDLLLGTRGWRRFDWVATTAPLPPDPEAPLVLLGMNGVGRGGGGMAELDLVAAQAGVLGALEGDGVAFDVPAAPAPEPVAAPEPAEPVEGEIFEAPVVAAGEALDQRIGGLFARDERQARRQPVPVRVFPVPAPDPTYEGPRVDFRDTIYWAPRVQTDADGRAQLRFPASDAVTSFRVSADGVGQGLVGHGEATVTSTLPFSLAAKLPPAVTEGDRLELPLSLANETDRPVAVDLQAAFGDALHLVDADPSGRVALAAGGRDARYAVLDVVGTEGTVDVALSARGAGLSDQLARTLTVAPRGFPRTFSASGQLEPRQVYTVDTSDARAGTVDATLTLYPSPLSSLVEGLDGMLQEPGGCFEQTSSTNYPNVMVMRYLEAHDAAAPEVAARARGLMARGYDRLVGFETAEKGYEWFGSTPPHEALTAYGLVEFLDMQPVHAAVDGAMVDRTAAWLLSRRDGHGGYQRSAQALDAFGSASPAVTDAYVTWALARAGRAAEIPDEVARSRALAADTDDVYLLALAADTLLRVDEAAGHAAAARLAALQDADGGFTRADHSITRSGGSNLHAEATALAVLALLRDGQQPKAVRDAVGWLEGHRSGWGTWGATQATVLSLQALTAWADASRATPVGGTVAVRIDGRTVATRTYPAGTRDPIVLDGLGAALAPGRHEVEVLHDSEGTLPFALGAQWRTERPAGAQSEVVGLTTTLDRDEADLGDTVRLTATVTNRTDAGQPMTVARIGLPAGTQAQPWQLEVIRRTGAADFVETGTSEVVLYWRALAPGAVQEVALDLIADVPGRFTGQSSSAWLYYDDAARAWADPVAVRVRR
ncbi:MAG: alpha-2-macroglobulin family protein [Myxococcota bacterium]